MLDALAATAGLGYFVAVAALFGAAFIAKAGAPRSPTEEPERPSFIMAVVAVVSALTPLALVLVGYVATAAQPDQTQRLALMGLPIVAGFAGSLLGAVVGYVARRARVLFRMASIVAGLGAFILALGVAAARIDPQWAASETARLIQVAGALTQ